MSVNVASVLVQALVEAGKNPGKTAKEAMVNSGKKLLGCFPIYTPEEIVYAAGMIPVGMWGGDTEIKKADKYVQSFCCSIMRANLEQGMNGMYDMLTGVIIPTYCDTMKAILATWPLAVENVPVFPLVYPQNRFSDISLKYISDEYAKLLKQLEELTGKKITEQDLEDSFQLYEECRALQRELVKAVKCYPVTLNAKNRHYILKAALYMDKKEYVEKLRELLHHLKQQQFEISKGPKFVISGLLLDPEPLLDLFIENKITIIADDLAQESRQFRTLSREGGSVIERLAYRIIDIRGCAFFYEEQKSKGDMLKQLVQSTEADGVVVCMMKFCDPEEFDYPVIKETLEAADIPLLYIEIDQQMKTVEQLRTRIQSFTEIME